MAAATFGLVSGGLLGGPVGTRLITKNGLRSAGAKDDALARQAENASLDAEIDTETAGEAPTAYGLLRHNGLDIGKRDFMRRMPAA